MIMKTEDLFVKFNRIYQSCEILKNLQVACTMRDLSSCRELTAFYAKLTEGRGADELYYWCAEDNTDSLRNTIEEERGKLCTLFEQVCQEMSARFEFGDDACNQKILISFSRVFSCLATGLRSASGLRCLAKIHMDFLAKIDKKMFENFSEIFWEITSENSLTNYLHEFFEVLANCGYSAEKQGVILDAFGGHVVKISLGFPQGTGKS